MSFLDSAKDKLSTLAADHPDQVEQLSDQAIEHGGDAADRMTGGTHAGQVDRRRPRPTRPSASPDRSDAPEALDRTVGGLGRSARLAAVLPELGRRVGSLPYGGTLSPPPKGRTLAHNTSGLPPLDLEPFDPSDLYAAARTNGAVTSRATPLPGRPDGRRPGRARRRGAGRGRVPAHGLSESAGAAAEPGAQAEQAGAAPTAAAAGPATASRGTRRACPAPGRPAGPPRRRHRGCGARRTAPPCTPLSATRWCGAP